MDHGGRSCNREISKYGKVVINHEILWICEFVWPPSIFRRCYLSLAFDWWRQTAKTNLQRPRISGPRVFVMQSKNFEKRKFHEILTLVGSEAIIFFEFSSLTRISLLVAPWFARVPFVLLCIFAYVSGGTALRVHPAVTRLTVYRRPYVVFNQEILWICEFVWPPSIFRQCYLSLAFDWWRQMACRDCFPPSK